MFKSSAHSLVLPEMFGSKAPAVPIVKIDDSLGIPPEAVGFDFDAFYDLTRTIGYTDDEIRTHIQYFSARTPAGDVGGHGGRTATTFVKSALAEGQKVARKGRRYVERTYGVNILQDLEPASVVNEVAIHELGHDHDDLHLDGRRTLRIARASNYTPRAVALGSGVHMAVQMATAAPETHIVAPFFAMMAAGAIAVLQDMVGPRVNQPAEGFAYPFQEQYGQVRIVNFDPAYLDKLANA